MLKDQILKYFSNNSKGFIEKYTFASRTADIDAIHDMRVCLKRIDTLIRMLNYNKKSNFRLKNCFKPLRQIFKKSGPVRDLQVQVVLIEDFKKIFFIDEKLSRLIIAKKNELVNEFLKISKAFKLIRAKRSFKLIEKYLNLYGDSELENQIKAFKQSRYRFIEKYSQTSNAQYNLHRARKQIKDLAYLAEMSKETILAENMPLAKYKEAGHILGDWHDRDVMDGILIELKGHNTRLNNDNLYLLEIKIKEDKENFKNTYLDIYKSW